MSSLKLFFHGFLPWETWLEEHPTELLEIAIVIFLIALLIFW